MLQMLCPPDGTLAAIGKETFSEFIAGIGFTTRLEARHAAYAGDCCP